MCGEGKVSRLQQKKTYPVALGGMTAALSLIVMAMSRVIPYSEQALPAIAGVFLLAMVMEAGPAWSLLVYLSVSLLSLFFAVQNGAAVYYIVFFGPYPILKNYIEHLHGKPLQWVLKVVYFNLSAVVVYYATVFLLSLGNGFLKYGLPIALVAVNIILVIYDIALTRLVVWYVCRIRKKLFRRGGR